MDWSGALRPRSIVSDWLTRQRYPLWASRRYKQRVQFGPRLRRIGGARPAGAFALVMLSAEMLQQIGLLFSRKHQLALGRVVWDLYPLLNTLTS